MRVIIYHALGPLPSYIASIVPISYHKVHCMERINLSHQNLEECVQKAASALRAGGVILYPTDTLYGLGADALSDKAVGTIYAIKGRDEKKPVHCIVADLSMAEEYAYLNDEAMELAEAFFPGPLTLILKKREEFKSGIAHDIQSIGVRVPDNEFSLTLAQEYGKPITATSANVSGEKPACSVGGVLSQLGSAASKIDIIVDAGKLPANKPSTVVDVSSTRPVILREGAILVTDIWDTLRAEY